MLKRFVGLVATAVVVAALPVASATAVSSTPTTDFPQVDGTVRVIAHKGHRIYIGGDFDALTGADGTVRRRNAAAINANTGKILAWNPRVRGVVRDLSVKPEGVYIVGSFDRVKGKARKNVARVNTKGGGKLQKAFKPQVFGAVRALDVTKKTIYIGGQFSRVGVVGRASAASFARSTGKLRRWSPQIRKGDIQDLDAKKSGVYLGGTFKNLNHDPAHRRVGLVTKKSGRTKETFSPVVRRPIADLQVKKSWVFAAARGGSGGGVYGLSRDSGVQVWEHRMDGDAIALAAFKGELMVGGHFSKICSTTAQAPNNVCVDGEVSRNRGLSLSFTGDLTRWNPQANGLIGIAALDRLRGGSGLLSGGDFTRVGNGAVPVKGFAVFNSVG